VAMHGLFCSTDVAQDQDQEAIPA